MTMRVLWLGQGDPPAPYFKGTGPAFPDHNLVSLDDEQVKGCMIASGATDLLQDSDPALAEDAPAYIRAQLEKGHPTHWLMFIRWEHAKKPADNGYGLHGYLKRTHSHSDFCRHVKRFFETNGGGYEDHLRVREWNPQEKKEHN